MASRESGHGHRALILANNDQQAAELLMVFWPWKDTMIHRIDFRLAVEGTLHLMVRRWQQIRLALFLDLSNISQQQLFIDKRLEIREMRAKEASADVVFKAPETEKRRSQKERLEPVTRRWSFAGSLLARTRSKLPLVPGSEFSGGPAAKTPVKSWCS